MKISKHETNLRIIKIHERGKYLSCPICKPRRGCNRTSKYDNDLQSWKSYRDYQWKN